MSGLRGATARCASLRGERKTETAARRLPDLVREVVHRLHQLQPDWGSKRIATWLGRIGIDCSRSSAQRIRREKTGSPIPPRPPAKQRGKKGALRAKRPNHMWQSDVTQVRFLGFFVCYVTAVIDLFSRTVLAIEARKDAPTARSIAHLVERAIRTHGVAPKHFITDQGTQFVAKRFNSCLRKHHILHRYGGIRSPASIALLERFWRTLKSERGGVLWPFLAERELQRRLDSYVIWFNAHRPHQGLSGATPDDVYFHRSTRQRPRRHGVLRLRHLDGDRGLPIYSIARSA